MSEAPLAVTDSQHRNDCLSVVAGCDAKTARETELMMVTIQTGDCIVCGVSKHIVTTGGDRGNDD